MEKKAPESEMIEAVSEASGIEEKMATNLLKLNEAKGDPKSA